MNLHLERHLPTYGAVGTALAWHLFAPGLPKDDKEFLAAAISLGAVLTGFIATAKAILAALPSDDTVRRLQAGQYWESLVKYLASALQGCLAFSVLSLLGFFLIPKPNGNIPAWYGTLWSSSGVFALLAFHRVTSILFTMISSKR